MMRDEDGWNTDSILEIDMDVTVFAAAMLQQTDIPIFVSTSITILSHMIDMIGDMKTGSAQRSSIHPWPLDQWISRQEISPDMAESGGEEGMKEQMKQAWRPGDAESCEMNIEGSLELGGLPQGVRNPVFFFSLYPLVKHHFNG
jgi:hypothetical protein